SFWRLRGVIRLSRRLGSDVEVARVPGQEGEDLRVELAGALDHWQVSAFVQEDDFDRERAAPFARRLRVYDLVLFAGDDEDGNLYDPRLAHEPAARDLTPRHLEGLGERRWGRLARVVHDLLGQIVGIEDERTHPEPAYRLPETTHRVKEGADYGQGGEPQKGWQVY